jgi:LPS O-antigen subunit length determinant protein (WzzB/FepE family)
VSLTGIVAIIVACLAVVAIAAGVRLLHKKQKEQAAALETPEGGALDNYGGGSGMTPKENVLLL